MNARRIVVLVSDEEYAELKRRAGIAAMSAYIKSILFPYADFAKAKPYEIKEIEESPKIKKEIRDTISETLHGGGVQDTTRGKAIAEGVPQTTKCPHHKAKGEVCYKCDPKWGYPVIL